MIGTKVGEYLITEEIGDGGHAFIFKGEAAGKLVAIKMLKPSVDDEDNLERRFVREAERLKKLKHPNIARFIDYYFHNGYHFMVMEFLGRGSVDGLLQANGPLDPRHAVPIMDRVLDALDFCHQRDIIHRDIKPGNIQLGLDGEVKLIDFGISRSVHQSTGNRITKAGFVLGTTLYMAPEFLSEGVVSEQTDIYASGVTFYELMTGRNPFEFESEDEPLVNFARRVCRGTAVPPREYRPTLEQSIERIILKAMAQQPKERYRNARDFRRDLRRTFPDLAKREVRVDEVAVTTGPASVPFDEWIRDLPELTGRDFGGYVVGESLGRGGQAVAYRATSDGEDFAIKFLLGTRDRDAEAQVRFEREVESLTRLSHPGICRIVHAGYEADVGAYLVMDLISGEPLSKLASMRGRGALAEREAAAYVAAAGEAVAFMHKHGIVHGDIKPSNIVVSENGKPTIIDFGIARTVEQLAEFEPGLEFGTRDYMAPERLRGSRRNEALDHRIDVYSLGATLYSIVQASDSADSATILTDRPLPKRISLRISGLSKEMKAVLLKSMATDPKQRYESAELVAEDLHRIIRGDPVHAPLPGYWAPWHHFFRHRRLVTTVARYGQLRRLMEQTKFVQSRRDLRSSAPSGIGRRLDSLPFAAGLVIGLFLCAISLIMLPTVGIGAVLAALAVGSWAMFTARPVLRARPTPAVVSTEEDDDPEEQEKDNDGQVDPDPNGQTTRVLG